MNYLEVDMTYGEMFLFAWAVLVTVLYVVTKHNAKFFRAHTLYKLKMVADGKAKIVATDDYVMIEVIEEIV